MTNHIEACQVILEDLRATKIEQIELEEEAAKNSKEAGFKSSPEYLELVDRNHRIGTHIDKLQVALEYHTGMVSLEVATATIRYYNYNGDPNTPGQHEDLPAEGYIIESKG